MGVIVLYVAMLFLGFQQEDSFFSYHYMGMKKEDIKKSMLENHGTLRLNNSNVNPKYNYLKFEDHINEITVLFFLSDSNTCKRIRLMSDYGNINTVLEDLKENYKATSRNKWEYLKGAKEYAVILDEGDWFFTVTIKNKAEDK